MTGFTETLGPIRVDPSEPATHSRVVREALKHIAERALDPRIMTAAATLAIADDETLNLLRRLLK